MRKFTTLLIITLFFNSTIKAQSFFEFEFTGGSLNNTSTSGAPNLSGSITSITDRTGSANDAADITSPLTGASVGTTNVNEMTLGFWMKHAPITSNERIIQIYGTDGRGFRLQMTGSELLYNATIEGNNSSYITKFETATVNIDNNAWHHIAVRTTLVSTSILRFDVFVDGILVPSLSNTTLNIEHYANGLTITNFLLNANLVVSPTNNYSGDIDDIYFYKYALTDTQIANMYYSSSGGAPISTVYVNQAATGDNDGTSWANAYADLQDALSNFYLDEVWVAKGTYTPDASDRDVSFTVTQPNLKIYGGFNGTETAVSERDVIANPTILSGDLLGDDDANITYNNTTRDDNSFRIVQINADNTTIDGVTIANGYADQASGEARFGAGLDTDDSVTIFTIKNSIIKNNVAYWGAGLVLSSDMPTFTMTIDACTFDENLSNTSSSFYAVANASRTMNLNISNSLFKNNRTEDNTTSRRGVGAPAGFIRAYFAGSTINANVVNNTFVNNLSLGTGTSDFPVLGVSETNGSLNFTASNNVFWGNTKNSNVTSSAIGSLNNNFPSSTSYSVNNSIDEDNFSNLINLTNTSNSNPLFTDAANNDFTLQTTSPAIDSGDNNQILSGITGDLLGNQRIYNTTVDMGCYEFGSTIQLGIHDFNLDTFLKMYPNPVTNLLNIEMNGGFEYAEIYSITGQKVFEFTTERIDISNLSKGIYLLKVQSTSGQFSTKRFIKQ